MDAAVCLSENTSFQRIKELRKQLNPLLSAVKEVERRRQDFRNSYVTWLPHSKNAIDLTTKVKDEIISVNQHNNSVSMATAIGGTAGIIMVILGTVAAIFTGRTSLILTGGGIFVGSAAISIGSSKRKDAINDSLSKKAAEGLEKYNKDTVSFEEKCLSYFRALDYFNYLFNTVSRNDEVLALFYEALHGDESDGLELFNCSKNEASVAFRKNIESEMKLKPWMLSIEHTRETSNQMKIIAVEVRKLLNGIAGFVKNDPYLTQVFRDKFNNFLTERTKGIQQREAQFPPTSLTTQTIASLAMVVYLRVCLIQAIQLASLIFDIASVAKRIVSLATAVDCFDYNSQSDKEISDDINSLKEIRNDITEGIRNLFGW